MNYQEKKSITYLFTRIPLLLAYLAYSFWAYRAGGPRVDDLAFWAKTMLIFTVIGIAFAILTQILLHIGLMVGIEIQQKTNREVFDTSEFEIVDEMETAINQKATRIGYAIVGCGFLFSLILLALDISSSISLNVLFIAFSFASLSEGFVQLYYFKRGI